MRLWKQFALAIVMSVAAVGTTDAGVITNGTVSVGITPNGNLFDGGIGFRRLAGSVDPISPGVPKEAWGASIGAVGSRVDPAGFGITNIVANGSSFLPASATTSSFVNNGANRMRVDHSFSFVASNAMAIDVKMTNVSGAAGNAMYRRIGDWDIAPTFFNEGISANALSGPVVNGTFQGFQDANPLTGLGSLFPAGGGGPFNGDNGGGLTLDFGSLANGASTDFRLIYAISTGTQTEAELRAQLAALGAFYIISGRSNATSGNNFFAIGVVAAIPEPASMTVFGAVAIGGVVTLLRRRKVIA